MTDIKRKDKRSASDIRPITLTRNYLPNAEGSCLVEMGMTKVITTASIDSKVPNWLIGSGKGWVTAEYGMLPRSTNTRMRRPVSSTHQNGRTMEIQRLIGRSLRAVTRMDLIGERTIHIDCDVISADGGTRVASIIGATCALHDAGTWLINKGKTEQHIMSELLAAISIGIVDDKVLVDLCYEEDSTAGVDMNVVMTESGGLIEVQGAAEKSVFDRPTLNTMLDEAEKAIRKINDIQRKALGLL